MFMVHVNAATFTGRFLLTAMSKKSLVIFSVPRNHSGISQKKRIPHSAQIQKKPIGAQMQKITEDKHNTPPYFKWCLPSVQKTQQSNFTANSDHVFSTNVHWSLLDVSKVQRPVRHVSSFS